jgi:hypothetical protein
MFNRKKTIVLTLLSMIFLIPSLGLAFDGQGRKNQNREDMFLNCLSSISLTTAQGKTVELKPQTCAIKQNAKLEIAELLTPEQRLELKTFIEKMKKVRQNNRGKRGMRRIETPPATRRR